MQPINLQQFIQTGLLNEFSGLFQDQEMALLILGYIGYPNYNRPVFPTNGSTTGYWLTIGRQIESGVLPGGERDLRVLVHAALSIYPSNPLLQKNRTQPTTPKPPSPANITQQGLKIFLAHASEDKPEVRKLCDRLEQAGHQPWLDERSIIVGQDWKQAIRTAIEDSDLFIACLSKESVAKRGYVQREFRFALNLCAEHTTDDIFLLPLRFDECRIPDLRQDEYGLALRNYQWLDYWEPDGFDRLLQAIALKQSQR